MIESKVCFNDPVFSYFGIFDKTEDGGIKAFWNRSMIRFDFSGSAIGLSASSVKPVKIFLDGFVCKEEILAGEVTVQADGDRHTVTVVSDLSELVFYGVTLAEDAILHKTKRGIYIRFIGDSITNACPGFSYFAAEKLGVAHSIQSYCGMSLVDGWGWYKWENPDHPRPGMESTCFLLERPDTPGQTTADLSLSEQPDILCVFLGTNDYLNSPKHQENGNLQTFTEHMLVFVRKLKKAFPDATICLMQALSDPYCRREGIRLAFQAVLSEYPDSVLIPSDQWEIELADETHPTEAGYRALGEQLCQFFEKMIAER